MCVYVYVRVPFRLCFGLFDVYWAMRSSLEKQLIKQYIMTIIHDNDDDDDDKATLPFLMSSPDLSLVCMPTGMLGVCFSPSLLTNALRDCMGD